MEEKSAGEVFTDNILRLAGMHRLTQAELGEVAGVSKQTLSRWKRGGPYMPSMKLAVSLAEFFEVDAGRLVGSSFVENLAVAADPRRFENVERKIRRRTGPLRAVK